MPPQPGIPPQQQGMRPPMPPHGNYTSLYFLIFKGFVCCLFFISEMSSTVKNSFSRMQLCSLKKKKRILCILNVLFIGQYGAHHQGMPGYLPGAMPPYGQGPPMVPPYQSGPPRPPMGMRPPVMSQGGRY